MQARQRSNFPDRPDFPNYRRSLYRYRQSVQTFPSSDQPTVLRFYAFVCAQIRVSGPIMRRMVVAELLFVATELLADFVQALIDTGIHVIAAMLCDKSAFS